MNSRITDLMKYPIIALILSASALLSSGCVRKKIYNAAVVSSAQCSAREEVLKNELATRIFTADKMTSTIGELNRTIGRQESDIAELRLRIVQLTNSATKTSSALQEEKNALEKELMEKTKALDTAQRELSRIQKIMDKRATNAASILDTLEKSYADIPEVTVSRNRNIVTLTFPDAGFFDKSGVSLTSNGTKMLAPLASLLTSNPAQEIELAANTDNQLPKGNKSLTDTWDWSLRRATLITRILINDLGVNANQISPVGRGEFSPVASNETAEGRLANRRTEVIFKISDELSN